MQGNYGIQRDLTIRTLKLAITTLECMFTERPKIPSIVQLHVAFFWAAASRTVQWVERTSYRDKKFRWISNTEASLVTQINEILRWNLLSTNFYFTSYSSTFSPLLLHLLPVGLSFVCPCSVLFQMSSSFTILAPITWLSCKGWQTDIILSCCHQFADTD